MALELTAEKYPKKIEVGYLSFYVLRTKIAYAYSEELGDRYLRLTKNPHTLTEEEIAEWNTNCNDDLDLLLWHSDMDGKLTVEECERLNTVLKKLEIKFEDEHFLFLFDEFFKLLEHCCKEKVPMLFS